MYHQQSPQNQKYQTTVMLPDSFKGFPIIGVWKTNANGQKVPGKPIVSFGLNKAKAILDHIDEIREWVEQQEAERSGRASTYPGPQHQFAQPSYPPQFFKPTHMPPPPRLPAAIPTNSPFLAPQGALASQEASAAQGAEAAQPERPTMQIKIESLTDEEVKALKARLGL